MARDLRKKSGKEKEKVSLFTYPLVILTTDLRTRAPHLVEYRIPKQKNSFRFTKLPFEINVNSHQFTLFLCY